MARTKRNELTAGIFVIVALLVLIGVVIWLGGAGLLRPTKQKATFFAKEQVGSIGLQKGNFVQVGDDPVGQITKIHFDPQTRRTYYTAEIDRGDFKIYGDGEAHVVAALIGGAKLVIVDRGNEKAGLADADHAIELTGGLDQTMSDLGSVAEILRAQLSTEKPDALLAKIHEVINMLKSAATDVAGIASDIKTETNRDNDGALLAKIHHSTDDINQMTADARPKVEQALTAVRDTAEKIRQYTDEDIAEMLTKLRQANTEILTITQDFSTVSGQVKQMVMLHRDNIDEMIDNMTQVSANLKAASKEIRRNPWRLLYKPDDKELHSQNIYDAARAFSSGAEQLDQAVGKLTGLAKAAPEGIPVDDPQLQKVRDQLQEAFEQFSKAEQALWKELSQ